MNCFSCGIGGYVILDKERDFFESEDVKADLICDNCGKEFDDEAALKLIESFKAEDRNKWKLMFLS